MRELFAPFFRSTPINISLLTSTLFIHILAMASALYVTLVFSRYLSHGLDFTLITLTIGTLVAMVLEQVLRGLRRKLVTALVAREERARSEAVMNRMLNARLEQLQQLTPAERAEAMRGLEQVHQAATASNLLSLLDAPFALLFWVALMLIAWQLGLIALLIGIVTIMYIYAVAMRLNGMTANLQKAHTAYAGASMSADRLEMVRAVNAAPSLFRRWRTLDGEVRHLRFNAAHQQDRLMTISQVATALSSMAMIGAGAKFTTVGLIDVGVLFGTSILATRMLSVLVRPAQIAGVLMNGLQAHRSLQKLLALPVESEEGVKLPQYEGRLEFNDVSFTYPGTTTPIFESLSVAIPSGGLVVVNGANGTGKTTLARLVAGLLSAGRGSVLADGVDVRQFSQSWWRLQIVYIPQEPEFFDGTLQENLTTLNPQLTTDELRQLLEQVGLSNFVNQHPLGLGMQIVQGGRSLSPGIRRRLAIARALTTRGRLIIIDEPMEGLDSAGVRIVNQLLGALKKEGRTLILCTQNPAPELLSLGIRINLDQKPVPEITMPAETMPAEDAPGRSNNRRWYDPRFGSADSDAPPKSE